MAIQYIMRAFKTTIPSGHVYWTVLNTPDLTGTFSGYNTVDLINIAIDYTLNNTSNTDKIIPTSVIINAGTTKEYLDYALTKLQDNITKIQDNITKIQDNPVINTLPGSMEDGYALTWVNDLFKYQFKPIEYKTNLTIDSTTNLTQFILSNTSSALAAGNAFCIVSNSSPQRVTLATPTALSNAGMITGFASATVMPGSTFFGYVSGGTVPHEIFNLGDGYAGPFTVNSNGIPIRALGYSPHSYFGGVTSSNGDLIINPYRQPGTSSCISVDSAPYNFVSDVSNITADHPTGGTDIGVALQTLIESYDTHTCPPLEFGWHNCLSTTNAGYKMNQPLILKRKVHLKGKNTNDIRFGGTIIWVPAGVTPFILHPATNLSSASAFDSIFENIRIAPMGRLLTHRKIRLGAVGDFTLTGQTLTTGDKQHNATTVNTVTTYAPLIDAETDDFQVDQIIGIEGVGPGHVLQRVYATINSDGYDGYQIQIKRESSAVQNLGGIHAGAYLTIPGAYTLPTRVNSWVFNTSGDTLIVTMASRADGYVADATITYYMDHICRILTKTGTGNSATYTVDSSFAGCVNGQLELNPIRRMYHADTAIYGGAKFTAINCCFGGVNTPWAGAGVTIAASVGNRVLNTNGSISTTGTNANCWRLEDCQWYGSRYGLYVWGTDANVGLNINPIFQDSDLWNEVMYPAYGSRTINAHYKGGYGYISIDSSVSQNCNFGSYSEGGTYCSLGATTGCTLIGGSMPTDAGGMSFNGGMINKFTVGHVVNDINRKVEHETQFFPDRCYANYKTVADHLGMSFKLLNHDGLTGNTGMIGWSWSGGSGYGRIPLIFTMVDATFPGMNLADGDRNAGHMIVPRGFFLGAKTEGAPDTSESRWLGQGAAASIDGYGVATSNRIGPNIRRWRAGDRYWYTNSTDGGAKYAECYVEASDVLGTGAKWRTDNGNLSNIKTGGGTAATINAKRTSILTTTNALTVAASYALPDEAVTVVNVTVVAKQQNAADGASFVLTGTWYRDAGGNATLLGSITTPVSQTSGTSATWTAVLVANATAIEVKVAGETGKNIMWSIFRTGYEGSEIVT